MKTGASPIVRCKVSLRRMIHRKLASLFGFLIAAGAGMTPVETAAQPAVVEYSVPSGSGPHDVAPAEDGRVWFTAQRAGSLGWLNPKDGSTGMVSLGKGSRPHGVIVGPDGAPWVTDGGLNAIVRVDPATHALAVYPLHEGGSDVDLNSAAFDGSGTLWFTGEAGYYGRLRLTTKHVDAFRAPEGPSPYGISSCTDGMVYFVSLAASYLGLIGSRLSAREHRQATLPATGYSAGLGRCRWTPVDYRVGLGKPSELRHTDQGVACIPAAWREAQAIRSLRG